MFAPLELVGDSDGVLDKGFCLFLSAIDLKLTEYFRHEETL